MAEDGKPAAAEQSAIPDPRLTSQGAISDEALRKAEEFVEQEEGAANRLIGMAGIIVTAIAIAMTLFHLYAAYDIVPTQPLRYIHVAFVMVLCFLLFPVADAVSQPDPLVGRDRRGRLRRDPGLCHCGRRGVHRPRRPRRTGSTSYSA